MNRERLGVGSVLLVLSCSGKLDVGAKATGGAAGGSDPMNGTGGVRVITAGGSSQIGTGGTYDPGTGGTSAPGTGGTSAPGTPGQSCIPGELAIEAQGISAETTVRTLDRCSEGYSCSAAKTCVLTETCAGHSVGDCLVYATAGIGGRAGTPVFNGTGGTFGGTSNTPAGVGPPVTSLTSDDSHVYFTAYGSRDRLGNFKNDGALTAVSLEDGATTMIAGALPGPIAVGVTSSHAYILVDGAPLIGSTTHLRLLRVALTGGTPEIIQDIPTMLRFGSNFVASGAQPFWPDAEAVYTMTPAASVPSIFLPETAELVTADDSNLYYYPWRSAEGILRMPLEGGEAEQVAVPLYPFGVKGDFLYGAESIENGTGLMLDRVSASGGNWERVRALGGGGAAFKLQIVGDRFFVDTYPPEVGPYVQADWSRLGVLTGLFNSDSPPVRILERMARRTVVDQLWVGTAKALFWSDGDNVYSRSLDPEP